MYIYLSSHRCVCVHKNKMKTVLISLEGGTWPISLLRLFVITYIHTFDDLLFILKRSFISYLYCPNKK